MVNLYQYFYQIIKDEQYQYDHMKLLKIMVFHKKNEYDFIETVTENPIKKIIELCLNKNKNCI